MSRAIQEHENHGFVDGALPKADRRAVEARLRADPAVFERARAYARQNDALHEAFDRVLAEAHTPRLPESRCGAWRRAAALALGIGIGFLARDQFAAHRVHRATLAPPAALAHVAYVPEVLHPVEVVAQEEPPHPVAWLSKRLDAPPARAAARRLRVPAARRSALAGIG